MEAKGCRQAKVFMGEEQPIGWTAGLIRLNRSEAKTLVYLINGQTKVNYHGNKTGISANSNGCFCGVEEETRTCIPL